MLHQHARECVADQAEPASPHQPEPNRDASGRNQTATRWRAGLEPATGGLRVRYEAFRVAPSCDAACGFVPTFGAGIADLRVH